MKTEKHIEGDILDHRQYVVAARRLADNFSFGSDPSPWVGSGNEYVQSRVYQPGDSIRTIDWRVTARTGKLHVREYEAPKRLPVHIMLDTSASMTISSTEFSKYARALQIAGALALASLDHMRPVGLIGCGSSDVHVLPTLLPSKVHLWVHKMRRYSFLEKTKLGTEVRHFTSSTRDASMVIILSDLHDPDGVSAIKHMSWQHDTIVIQLRDPAEKGKIGGGIFRTREAETGRISTAHGLADWFKHKGYDSEAEKASELKTARVDHIILETDDPIAAKLKLFFDRRGIGGGRAAQ